MSTGNVAVPLPKFIQEAARESARTVIKEHTASCPIAGLSDRVSLLERRFYILVGAILGSGVLSGTVAAVILRTVGG